MFTSQFICRFTHIEISFTSTRYAKLLETVPETSHKAVMYSNREVLFSGYSEADQSASSIDFQ